MQSSNNADSNGEDLYNAICQEIRERICLHVYPPGTLLSENALAAEFKVSRPWLRAVLQRLEFERLLTRQAGGGVVVSIDDIKTVREAFHLRIRLYEVIAADSPQVWISQSDIVACDELLASVQHVRSSRDIREYGLLHIACDKHFTKFIQNSFLREYVSQLYYQTLRAWLGIQPELPWEEEIDSFSAEIHDSFEALRTGDLGAAALARRDHLAAYVTRLMAYLNGATARGELGTGVTSASQQ